MNHIFFTHSSTDGHLGCIHVLATADNAAVDMGLRHKWVTSVSLHTGHTMLFDYHSSLLMSEQGFSTLTASRSQENFVQAQTACLQTKLEKELLWKSKAAFCLVFTKSAWPGILCSGCKGILVVVILLVCAPGYLWSQCKTCHLSITSFSLY